MESDHNLELLSVTLMDVLSTVQSMRRTITNAQAGVERLRHGRDADVVQDLKRCLAQLSTEAGIATESIRTTTAPMAALYDHS